MKQHKVKRLRLFGSSVTGHRHKKSDVDILVDFKSDADLLDQVGLKIELERLLKKKVDVVTPGSLNKLIRQRVLKEAVPL